MTSKIEIPRLLAWRLAGLDPDYTTAQLDADEEELRALLAAAPVVERQEPSYTLPPSSKSAEYITVQKGVLSNAGDLVCFLAMRDDAIGERAKDLYEVLRKIILRPDLSPFVLTNQPAPVAVVLPEFDAAFEAWWESDGQYCRSGGGSYEKTFAYRAYEACLDKVKELNQ